MGGTTNNAPEFSVELAIFTLPENSAADVVVGTVTATDADDDALTYSLEGTDAASFDIDSGTGEIKTKSGVTYDYETKFDYEMTAKADDGNGGSATVDVRIALLDDQTESIVDDAIAPGRPTGLTVFPKSQTRIQLAWTAPEDHGSFAITGYRIEASEDAGSSWNAVARTRGARTDFRHGGLSAGDTRHYRVSAVSDGGVSASSDVEFASTLSAGPAATNPNLPPPTDVTAAPKLPRQILLGWWTPLILGGQIDEYKYRRRAVDTSDWTNWTTVNRAAAAFHSRFVNELDAGTTYEFQVRSVDKDDRYSETVSALATATGRPTISIARDTRSVEEGEPLRFTLSRGESHAHGRLYVIL